MCAEARGVLDNRRKRRETEVKNERERESEREIFIGFCSPGKLRPLTPLAGRCCNKLLVVKGLDTSWHPLQKGPEVLPVSFRI